jgi:hypothetical protein
MPFSAAERGLERLRGQLARRRPSKTIGRDGSPSGPKTQARTRRFFWMQWRLQPRKWVSGGAPTLAGTSALPRDCCSGVSMSAGGGEACDSAVIDSRYKPARQREILGGSTSGLTHSSAAKRRLRGTWPSRLCRRTAWLVIGEVATQNERNGTCRRMSLPGEQGRCRAACM